MAVFVFTDVYFLLLKKEMKMKYLILALTLISTSAFSSPEITMKVGGWPGASGSRNAGVQNAFMYSIQSSECGNHCMTPFFIKISSDKGENAGYGLDYVYKIKHKEAAFTFGLGVASFKEKLNGGESGNFHLSAGFQIDRVSFSVEHFSNGNDLLDRVNVDKNIPSTLLMVGYRF